MTRSLALALSGSALALFGLAFAASAQDDPLDGPPEDRAAMMIERIDTDGDGAISRAEMEAHHAARFEAADTNNDGGISFEEMQAARERRAAEHAQRMFARMDANGDGVITPDEQGEREHDPFARLDADGDGLITADELEGHKGPRFGRYGHGRGGPAR